MKITMNTILPLGKYLQVDEPEILTQATGIFDSVSQKWEIEENLKFLPIWHRALSAPWHCYSQSGFKSWTYLLLYIWFLLF